MRTDWFADLVPPAKGAGRDDRAMVAFRVTEAPEHWPVVIGAPGEMHSDVVAGLRRRYADRLIETRPYRPGGDAK